MSTHSAKLPVPRSNRAAAQNNMKSAASLAAAWMSFSRNPTLATFDHIQSLTRHLSQQHIICAMQIEHAAAAAGRDLTAERAAAMAAG